MENKATFIANLEEVVQLGSSEGEAFASLMQNPAVNWIKFTLTDNKPNVNKMIVPIEEFDNIISSGTFMPIKKAVGKIEKGHTNSSPLGVITHLKQVEDKIKGIAALWSKERPKDVEQIKEELQSGKHVDLSWELTYDVEASTKENENLILKNVFLTAATIVGLPAYKGRTSIEAFASDEEDNERKKKMEDAEKELEKLQKKYDATQAKLEELQNSVLTKDTELVGLKKFKEEVDKVETERKKLSTIKEKFTSAKIIKEDKYFDENKDKLLSLDENTLEFLLQDLKVFTAPDDIHKTEDKTKIPPITGPQPKPDLSPTSIGEQLREALKPQVK